MSCFEPLSTNVAWAGILALSGFILSAPFARAAAGLGAPVSVRRFYLRRLTRLEPPFLISTLAIFVLGVVAGTIVLPDAWPHLLATLTYTVHSPGLLA